MGKKNKIGYISPVPCPKCGSMLTKPLTAPISIYNEIWANAEDSAIESTELVRESQQELISESPKSIQEIFDEYHRNNEAIEVEALELKGKRLMLSDLHLKICNDFEKKTNLSTTDTEMLVLATILQGARIAITDKLKERISDQQSAKNTPGHEKEKSDRRTRRYYATLEEIKTNPVPFDAMIKSETVKNGGNPSLCGNNHRYKAVGHDPLVGLVIGTANILTKTITVKDDHKPFATYHVSTGVSHYRNDKPIYKDIISSHADTGLMFYKIYERIRTEGKAGWTAIYEAMKKEIVHLMSDARTINSLPIPFVSSISPNMARIMNICGLDSWTVTMCAVDVVFTKLINMMIALLHSYCYNPSKDESVDLYYVRTANIIRLSDEIASYSNVAINIGKMLAGDEKAVLKFDIGGLLVANSSENHYQQVFDEVKFDYMTTQFDNYLNNI